MINLHHESDIEILRRYSVMKTKEVELLRAALARYESMSGFASEWLSHDIKDQLSRLQKKFFGFGHESLKPRDDRPIGHQGEQLKLHGHRGHDEAGDHQKPKAKLEGDIPEVIEHEFTENTLDQESQAREVSQGAQGAWKKMKDFYQESVEITVTERVYKKVVHRQAKYRLKDEYNTTGKEVIITAPGPVKLKPGCQYSVDFALAVVSDKYEFHMPLERQRRKMEAAGLDIDVKTLYSLCQSVAEHMESVTPLIRRDIMNDFCAVHVDESPWLILGEEKKGQMWAMSNRLGSYYQFEPSRAGEVAEEMLGGYQGAVITDALAAYNRLAQIEGMRRGLCWAHVRREFYERMDDYPIAEEMVRMIDELFEIEAKATNFDELRELRKTESKAVILLMQKWLIEQSLTHLPGDGLMAAINYCAGHWRDLTTFLKDLSLPLSNNDAERALRHVVLGRKNFAGSKTINGADVAATLYTVIETAKKNGLQPKDYMKQVITERWHKREPKTPHQIAVERWGKNSKIEFPEKSDWAI